MICVVYSEINSVGIRYLVSYILPRVQTSTKRFFVSPASPIETNIVRYFVLRLGNIHRISSFWGNFTPETITRDPRVQNVFFFFYVLPNHTRKTPWGPDGREQLYLGRYSRNYKRAYTLDISKGAYTLDQRKLQNKQNKVILSGHARTVLVFILRCQVLLLCIQNM